MIFLTKIISNNPRLNSNQFEYTI